MNLDGLFGIRQVQPSAVAFPAFGEHLDEHAPQRRVGNMRDPVTIGLHIQFHGLVLLDLMLFDVFEVNAGVFNGCFFFASGDFNGDA